MHHVDDNIPWGADGDAVAVTAGNAVVDVVSMAIDVRQENTYQYVITMKITMITH